MTRERQPSAPEIAKAVVDAVEATGRHVVISDTPPALRLLQRWWWKVSVGVMFEGFTHWLHELLMRGHR